VLELAAPRAFGAALALSVLLAVGAIWLADLPLPVALVASVLAALFALRGWRMQTRLVGGSIRLDADGTLRWRDAAGTEGHGRLSQHTVLGPLLALEAIAQPGGRRRFALWRDMADADAWRRLRVDLLHRRAADSYKD
jgi:hypothetical protein